MSTTSDRFYNVIRPTVYLARTFALVPFSFETRRVALLTLVISTVVPSYYVYGITQVYSSMYSNQILPTFEKMMLILQVSATSSVTVSSWIVNHLRFNRFIDLCEKVRNVERQLGTLGFEHDLRARVKTQVLIILCIAFFSLQNVFDNVMLGENVIALFIIYTIAMLTLSHFLLLVSLIRQDYTFINDKLKALGDLTPEGLTDIVRLTEELQRNVWAAKGTSFQDRVTFKNTLRITMECHSELYGVCRGINKYFGLQILLNVTANILNVTSICYYVPAIVIDQSDKPHHYMIISIKSVSFIALFAFVQLWTMAYICSSTSDQANFTGILVHGIMNQPRFACHLAQLDVFSTQLLHQRVKFTAHGFFTIDFSLISTVIGVVITYIVILIQFQMSNQ